MSWMIYGSYGYTGRLITQLAVERGHQPTLAGRNEAKLKAQAQELGLPWSVVDLADAQGLRGALSTTTAVLHCAGPFSSTFQPMLDACLETGVHYLDITGEIGVLESAARQGVGPV